MSFSTKLITFILSAMVVFPAFTKAVTITINPAIQYQTITGIGGSDLESNSEAFAKNAVQDLGMSTYRLFRDFDIYEFEPTNDNADPNVTNWSALSIKNNSGLQTDIRYLRYLKNAGVKHFFYSVLAWPKWLKTNIPDQTKIEWDAGSGIYVNWCSGQCGGYYDSTKAEEYAECLSAYVKVFKDSVLEFNEVCLQNEPAFLEPYGSMVITPLQMRDLAKVVGRRFEKDGIKSKIAIGEDVINGGGKTYIGVSAMDSVARKYITAGAVHNYNGDGVTPSSAGALSWKQAYAVANKFGLPLWMTETSGFDNNWSGAMKAAQVMYTAFKYGNLALWAWLEFPIPDKNADIYGITKNYAKYIRPGAIQINAISPDTNVLCLTFRDKVQKQIISVLINRSSTASSVTLQGAGIPAQGNLYQSAAGKKCVDIGLVQSQSISIPGSSVNTFVGSNYDPVVGVTIGLHPQKAKLTKERSTYDIHGRKLSSAVQSVRHGNGVYIIREGQNTTVSKLSFKH